MFSSRVIRLIDVTAKLMWKPFVYVIFMSS